MHQSPRSFSSALPRNWDKACYQYQKLRRLWGTIGTSHGMYVEVQPIYPSVPKVLEAKILGYVWSEVDLSNGDCDSYVG